ncbi:LysR family transcriptional regulator [Marinomonas mediterranea]|jgi:transcriptional regulator|uniref:Transcriptional regulator, LysR family n=1 Tax=Marinomonas mediterranea (strain ATCC 700492 / JCM 21426 / NBRC 103028 / MMB-1) TaxID=717774 RepID=F2JXE5_MARM1|nr:LysR family transcriptional regulator [Marinomonas mediterranea]ADZ91845.1 transcriptional regulator, LysR family [Marinomonas mediterranea MMB-1]WCN09798.1 LysR family transcriptional regulator [Marinomonas mediterranea]WCN13881.1 LysR family transcriptional regulator [Marinomonas mediterranea]WCN17937.1 LysR family transcriptional regulator [Marinomonas mediterranea MMB-1]
MDIKQLRYFVAIAELASFTKAAEQLGVAQPAVSMAIKKLETDLGLTLIHRADRNISLTDEGNRLLLHARKIVQSTDDALLEMQELKGFERGEVRVGIPSMLGSYYFPPILMAFRNRFPDISLKVIEGGTWQLQKMLENGELDLGVIVAESLPESLETQRLLQQEMKVVVATDHLFSKKEYVTPAEFFKEELVMFKEGYFHRRIIDKLAEEAGVKANIGFETNLIPLIKSITEQGFGISTMLSMVISDEDQLITRSFEPSIWLDLTIAWRKDSYLSKANQAFLEFVCEQGRDI